MTAVRPGGRKRILVFSASFGGPHAEVAEALVAYLRNSHAKTVEVRLIDFLEQFAPNLNVLAKFGYQQAAGFFPSLSGDLPAARTLDPDNPLVAELASGAQARVEAYLDDFKPDAVVSVLPAAAAAASEAAKGAFVSVAVMSDLAVRGIWLHPATLQYFVATPEMRDELVVAGIEWGRVTVSGVPMPAASAAERPRAELRRELRLADRFTCVIDAPAGAGAEVLDVVTNAVASGVQVGVAHGRAPRLAQRLATLSRKSTLVHAFGKDTPVQAVLSAADIVVSGSGGSSHVGAMSLGMPLILYNPVPGQERDNVDFLVNCGAALLARDADDVGEKLRYLSTHPKRLHQMARDAMALSRPGAAETICERVLTMVN